MPHVIGLKFQLAFYDASVQLVNYYACFSFLFVVLLFLSSNIVYKEKNIYL